MELEFNPFDITISLGSAPIKSLQISSNLDWLDNVGTTITGENAVLPISAKTNVAALKVFATGVSTGTPSMISLLASHIPNIAISQVTGLQSAINSIVKTLSSFDSKLTVSPNGTGDYQLQINTGTTSGTVAIGNDTRFPANVTGLRKSSGAGSTDVAAVARTDYWDTSDFIASGASHRHGLVPDPGASAGTTKFLREDGTWVVPAGSGTVTSVGLALPGSVFSISGSPVTTAGTLTGAFINQSANLIFAGPTSGGAAAPTFRAHVYADISALVGTGASTIAAGNDTRFPASVTGLRKSSGAGSTDVAAVLFTDYWNNTVFGGKGPSHSIGLVPDPGAGAAPFTRYLREDGQWVVFTPDIGTITNGQLATMATKTVKANATGGTASPTDVDAKTARSVSLFNLESITTHGDSDYTMLSTDKYVATSANLTADRTWTLPLANTFNPSQIITISDDFGAIVSGWRLLIARQGADTIQGSSSSIPLANKFAAVTLASDGTSKWSIVSMRPSIRKLYFFSNTTYTTSTGVKSLLVELIGAGGGGAGGVASASNAAAGGGGGAGAYISYAVTSPASSYSVTIGSGGSGGVGAANGSNGTNTVFGGTITAGGGNGGIFMAGGNSPAFSLGGAGGTATGGGDVLTSGAAGEMGIRLSGTVAASGAGANATYAGGSQGLTSQGSGLPPAGYGSGGAGALSTSATSVTGGSGANGMMIITEFY